MSSDSPTVLPTYRRCSRSFCWECWTTLAGKNIVSTHVLVEPGSDGERIQQEAQSLLKTRFGVFFSTIQTETEICEEEEEAAAIDFLGTKAEPQPMDDHGTHG